MPNAQTLSLNKQRIPIGLSQPSKVVFEGPTTLYYYLDHPGDVFRQHGGAMVVEASLQLLFWGGYWQHGTDPSADEIVEAINGILSSPYLSELSQYGYQSLTIRPAKIVLDPGPSTGSYTGKDVKNMIWSLIFGGYFPQPVDPGGRIIYMVFAPPGTTYTSEDAGGAHSASSGTLFDVDYAWIGWVNHGSIDEITSIFSHELVESITDPEPFSGWFFDGMDSLEMAEACDMTGSHNDRGVVNGVAVQPYFSKKRNAFVIPGKTIERGLSVSVADSEIPGLRTLLHGTVEARAHLGCYKGRYDWTLIGGAHEVVLTPIPTSYLKPKVTWMVGGVRASSTPIEGTADVDQSLDPLSVLEGLPAEQTAYSFATDDKDRLTISMGANNGPCFISVKCEVEETENDLPPGYGATRTDERLVYLSGRIRTMDERFRSDTEKCLEVGLRASQAVLLADPILIDKGDPVPVWVNDNRFDALPRRAGNIVRSAWALAFLVQKRDEKLAERLRGLANATVATLLNRSTSELETGPR
ncbi:MAG TPA: hypothetical protein VHE55_12100 [Fimbriimonadaceae bacterium]|nr:hypothetical protein [Fimbriimonadaceae bacterium]